MQLWPWHYPIITSEFLSDIYLKKKKRGVLRGSLLACHLAAKMLFIHDDQKKNGTHLEKK